MSEPLQQLFYGRGTGPDILLAGDGADDGGQPIAVKAMTNPFIPAGEGGEALFTGLWLTVTHTAAGQIRVTPFVDDVAVTDSVYVLPMTATTNRETLTWELGVAVAIRDAHDASVVLATVAPRGTRLQVLLELLDAEGQPARELGDVIFETPSIEYEVVREARAAETPAAAL